jgi:hypothetical protein
MYIFGNTGKTEITLYSEMLEYIKENLSILQTEISQKQKILTVAKKYKSLLKYPRKSLFLDNKLIKHKPGIHFFNTFFDEKDVVSSADSKPLGPLILFQLRPLLIFQLCRDKPPVALLIFQLR